MHQEHASYLLHGDSDGCLVRTLSVVIDGNDMIAFRKDDDQMKMKKIRDLIKYLGLKLYLEENSSTVFDWLFDLHKKGVEELILEQCGNTFFYIVVTYLSYFTNLKSLSLMTVYLQFPKVIGKFESLIELSLIKVYIKAKDMEFLSTVCPKLEMLTLLPTYKLVPLLHKDKKGVLLKIHGPPSLKYFHTDFAYTEILGKFVEFVARGHIPWKVPFGNGHLGALYLYDVCLDNARALSVCFAIIVMLSNVQSINISVKKSKSSNCFKSFFQRQAETGVCFRQLRSGKMRYTKQFGAALDFLEFVIACSPNIKTISVIKDGSGQYSEETVEAMQTAQGICP